MRLNLWHWTVSQDRNVLRVSIHHDVRVMSHDNDLSIRLNSLQRRYYEVIYEFVIQIIFRLVKEEGVIAELEDNCKECGSLLTGRAFINFTKAILGLLSILNSEMIFGEPEVYLSLVRMRVERA